MAKFIATSLATLFPQPALITLQGGEFPTGQLRLKDLAVLEAWAVGGLSDPLEGLPTPEDDPDRSGRWDRLTGLWGRCLPAVFGSVEVADRLASAEGAAVLLFVVLSRHAPDFTPHDAVDLAGRLTSAEWGMVDAIAWGITPLDVLRSELEGPPDRPPTPADWGEVVIQLVKEYGLSFDEVGELTLGQLAVLRRGGKPVNSYYGPEFGSPQEFEAWTTLRKASVIDTPLPEDYVVPAPEGSAERREQIKAHVREGLARRHAEGHHVDPSIAAMVGYDPISVGNSPPAAPTGDAPTAEGTP